MENQVSIFNMESTVNIGLIQMRSQGSANSNLDHAISKIRSAAAQDAQLICLQELFASDYFCQEELLEPFNLAEPIPGVTTRRLGKISKELRITLIASLFEKRAPGIYHNTAVVLSQDGTIIGKYRKMHIPDDPHYYEKFYFTPGDLGYQSFNTPFGKIGILICWDQWFPEAARLTALSGAQIIFYPTAIGWLPGQSEKNNLAQHDAWQTIQRGHAIANGVFVAAVNRVGRENQIDFWGQSFVADPFGRIIGKASSSEEEILVVTCDLGKVEKTRREWCFLRDRRTDSYSALNRIFNDSAFNQPE
jgi:N-carbamoylputrescine amidase